MQIWLLKANNSDAQIKFTIQHLDIEYFELFGACVYDYLEISYEGFSWKYCGDGSSIQEPFISSGPTMTIKFHSDFDVSKTGFFATWEEINGKPFTISFYISVYDLF